jgi:hypothetical protein
MKSEVAAGAALMRRFLHWLIVAAIQCMALGLVFLLWSRIGPG